MTEARPRPTALAIWLIFASIVGWWAAFQLTLEKFNALENPGTDASCDFSLLVQCSKNLDSWQGSLFGFPNPIIGLTCWMAPLVVGVALLGGVRFPKWFWSLFTLGTAGAFALVCWLISQSIYDLATLCPWCMVTWTVTIPTFYATLLHGIRTEAIPLGKRAKKLADTLMGWMPLLAIVSYVIVALLAQLRLDWIGVMF
ncbi:MAG: vitamin K epoxide reductase family protein [Microbacterium sp.]